MRWGNIMSQMTKRALAQSLKNVLCVKPLTKVTVSDITEDCGVSRMTFYYHFKDIYDLVEWCTADSIDRVTKDNRTYDTWQQGYLNVFRLIEADRPFVMNIYHYVNREYLDSMLYKIVFDLMYAVVEEKAQDMVIPEKDKVFIANIYEYALVGVVLNWIKNDMKDDPAQLVTSFDAVVSGNIDQALEHFRQDTI
jgi:probable dihydroxyacetone kinase regulator